MLYTWRGVSFNPGTEVNLYEIGMQKCEPGYSVSNHIVPYNILHFVVKGKGRMRLGSKVFDVGAGEGFFSLQGTSMEYSADVDDPWYYAWVQFDGVRADEYLRSVGIWQSDPVFRVTYPGMALDRLQRMYDLATGDAPANEARIKSEAYALFADIMTDNAGRRRVVADERSKYVEAVARYMRDHISDDITIEGIAHDIGLNAHYLTELFHNIMGYAPQQYLINLRVQHACLLLQRTDMNISDIAHKVGYMNGASFGKIFRKVRGMSPREFRKCTEPMHVGFKMNEQEYFVRYDKDGQNDTK